MCYGLGLLATRCVGGRRAKYEAVIEARYDTSFSTLTIFCSQRARLFSDFVDVSGRAFLPAALAHAAFVIRLSHRGHLNANITQASAAAHDILGSHITMSTSPPESSKACCLYSGPVSKHHLESTYLRRERWEQEAKWSEDGQEEGLQTIAMEP